MNSFIPIKFNIPFPRLLFKLLIYLFLNHRIIFLILIVIIMTITFNQLIPQISNFHFFRLKFHPILFVIDFIKQYFLQFNITVFVKLNESALKFSRARILKSQILILITCNGTRVCLLNLKLILTRFKGWRVGFYFGINYFIIHGFPLHLVIIYPYVFLFIIKF